MIFAPISVDEWVKKYVKTNAGTKPDEYKARLIDTLQDYLKGVRCSNCGEPIWVIGAADVGRMCFTCITGEADPSGDYEIAEACDKLNAPGVKRSPRFKP